MSNRVRHIVVSTWQSEANLSVFLGLLVLTLFVLPSLGFGERHERRYNDIAASVLLISGVAIGWGQRWLFALAASVAGVSLLLRGMEWFVRSDALGLWNDVLSIAATGLIAWILLVQIFRDGPVTGARVQGAIAVYLLFGLLWANAYRIVLHVDPSAFQGTTRLSSHPSEWYYFSFVTLTTLGYGDIIPTSGIARSMAVAESLTGQLYLGVLIARLVAMQITSPRKEAKGEG